MFSFRAWRRKRHLAQHALSDAQWREVWRLLPMLQRLSGDETRRLRDLTQLFLHEKRFETAPELTLTDIERTWIATQACLPVLNLGLDWYDGWKTIVVYPDEFVTHHEEMDEHGIVHAYEDVRSGEAWLGGPVVLAWNEMVDTEAYDGHNLVIHEFAHKLDMLNGDANGMPPLHPEMSLAEWTRDFTAAFDDFQRRVDNDDDDVDDFAIDPYAAESPAEFFAVVSEVFFANPTALVAWYPTVYHQLTRFYRQDPARAET